MHADGFICVRKLKALKKKRLTIIFCLRPEAVFMDGTFLSFSPKRHAVISTPVPSNIYLRINTHGPELPQSKLPNYCWRLTRKAMTLGVVMQMGVRPLHVYGQRQFKIHLAAMRLCCLHVSCTVICVVFCLPRSRLPSR